MKKNMRNLTFLFLFLNYQCLSFAQNYSIDYYGVVSQIIDQNMAKMTSDLYYTQLSDISNFTVKDCRASELLKNIPDFQDLSQESLSFFSQIEQSESDDSWNLILHLYNPNTKSENILKKNYDSFYKILMESKVSLQETLKQLIESEENTQKQSFNPNPSKHHISTEALSGNWNGEDFINKIVILRGGRGFIIFKNGASMNISINIEREENKQKITIIQNSHSNASFFPDLPRNIALELAPKSEPIEWILYAVDDNTLTGHKKTLIKEKEDYISGLISVTWKRQK